MTAKNYTPIPVNSEEDKSLNIKLWEMFGLIILRVVRSVLSVVIGKSLIYRLIEGVEEKREKAMELARKRERTETRGFEKWIKRN